MTLSPPPDAKENAASRLETPVLAALSPTHPDSVAVIIAAWRAGRTIGRAVSSALAEPEAAEIIVIDDASGDDGATIRAAEIADDGSGRLRVIRLEKNGGPSIARNAAIASASSHWLTVLDADDFMEKGRLGRMLAQARLGYDFVADDLLQAVDGAEETRVPLWFRDPATAKAQDVDLVYFVRANLPDPKRPRGELGFLKPLMSRAFLASHGLAYDETMRLGEDFDLYARALAYGARFRLTPAAGYVSVERAGSLSKTQRREDLATFLAADDKLLVGKISDEARAALVAHRRTTERKIAWIDFIDALKAKKPGAAVKQLTRNWPQTAHILSGLGEIVVRRATGRKRV